MFIHLIVLILDYITHMEYALSFVCESIGSAISNIMICADLSKIFNQWIYTILYSFNYSAEASSLYTLVFKNSSAENADTPNAVEWVSKLEKSICKSFWLNHSV